MSSIAELMQLCRLCLVKDQVDVPIFEDSGDLHERCLKIAACLPVKVKKDDKLPKKICSGCSYKLDLLYQFYNTSASADKQLKTWLSQLEGGKTIEGEVSSKESLTKSEPSESGDAHSLSADAESYIMQQQKLPYQNVAFPFQEDAFVEPQPSSSGLAEETETRTPSKRKRKTIQTLPVPDSDEEDDPHSKIAKLENDSDSDNDNDNDNFIPDDTSDSEQPGPSGLGKVSGDTPYSFLKLETTLDIKKEPSDDEWYENQPLAELTKEAFGLFKPKGSATKRGKTTSKKNGGKNSTGGKNSSGSKNSTRNKNPKGIKNTTKGNKDQTDENLKTDETLQGDENSQSDADPELESDENPKIPQKKPRKKRGTYSKLIKDEGGITSEPEPIIWTCRMCQKTFKTQPLMRYHLKKVHGGYRCPHCDQQLENAKDFEKHLNAHSKELSIKCDLCRKLFVKEDDLKEHQLVCTGYTCEHCGKRYVCKPTLIAHVNSKHLGIKYNCEQCGKSFSYVDSYKVHLKMHEPDYEKYFWCQICNKKLSVTSKVQHKRLHRRDKCVCSICGKILNSNTYLKLHLMSHGEKLFQCEHCGKGFTQKRYLEGHKVTHTNVRSFPCKFCDKKFTQRTPLVIHMRYHTGERPYVCDMCPGRFVTKNLLEKHKIKCLQGHAMS